MHLQEVIFAATASSSGQGTLALHNIQTGTSLASFKQTNAARHCTAVVESGNGQGGFMLVAQQDKSILNVYNFQKDQLALKIVLPEKLSCLAIDPRGEFCAGATAQGRVYLWEVASGILYNAWDAHYRRVTVLKFTHDSAALISGSEDSGVSVWSVSRLLHDDHQNELPLPYCTFSDHTLPVTDIICGVGLFPTCRVLTSSKDHSVKLWDVASKSLLTTFQFPQPISCLAWDITERVFFAGSEDGSIHQMNLFRASAAEAIGGAGLTGIIRVEDESRLISVNQPLSCLAISLTSSLLLAGTATGHINVYDIASHQLVRAINSHIGSAVNHLATMLKPLDLIGAASINDIRDVVPVKPVSPFQRTRDAKARNAHEASILLPTHDLTPQSGPLEYTHEELLRDHAFFVQPTTPSSVPGVPVQKVADLEAEIKLLKEQLGKAKHINDTMWDTVVRRAINGKASGIKTASSDNAAMEIDG
ncbi:hypothetical protein PLEOSDRAFT_1077773 [Pleurotus ostreatus PC15]|uniref:Pre-rRNA-processing protein IPI3 n=1 Tax=Pleurotus ostreatus (strain PC15) TaxID=1137138 RepID=A0A067NTQ0_PLEO1|nr:hypothetical protein PLEOSDRAFT_1077773 [Pleurotus ostreatus PC15]